MLNRLARQLVTRLLTPFARALLAVGVSPDAVTLVGTLGVCLGALVLFPRGEFLWGALVVAVFAFSDTVDGIMARAGQRSSRWGAFLDSTLDRIGDAAVFGGLVLYYSGRGDAQSHALTVLSLTCLVLGSVVSYARARAEGLGMRADVGVAERADRLVAVLATAGLIGLHRHTGIGLPEVAMVVVLALLALASVVTIGQRMAMVHRQALAGAGDG